MEVDAYERADFFRNWSGSYFLVEGGIARLDRFIGHSDTFGFIFSDLKSSDLVRIPFSIKDITPIYLDSCFINTESKSNTAEIITKCNYAGYYQGTNVRTTTSLLIDNYHFSTGLFDGISDNISFNSVGVALGLTPGFTKEREELIEEVNNPYSNFKSYALTKDLLITKDYVDKIPYLFFRTLPVGYISSDVVHVTIHSALKESLLKQSVFEIKYEN